MFNVFRVAKTSASIAATTTLLMLSTVACSNANDSNNVNSNETTINNLATSDQSTNDKYPGYMVKYHYTGYDKEREVAYQFYLDHRSNMAGIKKDQLGIDLYDLDDDGEKEILLYINGGENCPRAGCPFTTLKILDLDNKKYKILNWSTETGGSIGSFKNSPLKMLNARSFGIHDILFLENNTLKPYGIAKWNGKYYNYSIF